MIHNKIDKNYIEKVLESEIQLVALTCEGNRNNQLNMSSFALGQFVGAGALDFNSVEQELIAAADKNGLLYEDKNAVLATIKSGLKAGILHPRLDFPEEKEESKNTETIYKYQDENNQLLFEVVRRDFVNVKGERDKKFYQKHFDDQNRVIYGIKAGTFKLKENNCWKRISETKDEIIDSSMKWFEAVKIVPYNLSEVLEGIKESKIIFYTEGEKNAEDLKKYEYVTTTNPLGACKEMPEYFYEYFKGAQCVVILEDNDDAGRKQTQLLIDKLKPYVKQLVVIQLPNLLEGEDISDWLNKGNSIENFDKLVKAKIHDEQKKENASKFVAININEFLNLKLPPRELLFSPWLPIQGLTMIHSYRGIGKTLVALNVAYAVASGTRFLKWQAPKPAKVLYVDGEMPASLMQERLSMIIKKSEKPLFDPNNLKLLNPDLQSIPGINFSNVNFTNQLYELLKDIDLLILDNLSTLTNFGKENESESWAPIQEMALDLRRQGKSILFIHHSGKNGLQRGTSKKEDILDTVITLKRSNDYAPEQGAKFEVHFEKNRGFYGEDAKPFEASLSMEGIWSIKDLEDKTDDQIIALTKEALTCDEIGKELGINKSTVSRRQKKLKNQGLL